MQGYKQRERELQMLLSLSSIHSLYYQLFTYVCDILYLILYICHKTVVLKKFKVVVKASFFVGNPALTVYAIRGRFRGDIHSIGNQRQI